MKYIVGMEAGVGIEGGHALVHLNGEVVIGLLH